MCGLRLACSCYVAIAAVLSSVGGGAWGADDYVAPPLAEREAVAALRAKGAIMQVDGNYRVNSVVLLSNCTNDDVKMLACCERLTDLQVQSAGITDDAIENLKALPKLSSILIGRSGLTEAGIANLRAAVPNLRTLNFGGSRGAPSGPPSGPGGTATRGTTTSGTFGGGPPSGGTAGPGGLSAFFSSPMRLATYPTVQDDLKLTFDQQQQIRAAMDSSGVRGRSGTDLSEAMRVRDEKISAVLTAEQRSRLKQIELQQTGISALAREEIAKELNLSNDQNAAARKAVDDTRASMTAVMNESRQSRTADSFVKFREKTTELNKQRDEKIQGLLDDEQRAAWLAMLGPKGPEIATLSGPGSFGSSGPPGTPPSPDVVARSAFDRTDVDRDGMVTETEFATIPDAVRQRMKDAGVVLEFPVAREDFEKAYTKYLETRRPSQPPAAPGKMGPVRDTTPPAGTRGQPANKVGVKFIESGVTARVGGYVPLRAEMNGTANSVKKAAKGLEAAKYGVLKIGNGSWAFILDEPEGKPAKLYVDTNGDGDLTNDPATTWAGRKSNNLTQYSGSGKVDLGGGSIGTINMYRFDPADAQRATLKNTLMFYPDYGYELTLTPDGKQFTAAVAGEGGPMPIWIDRDGNKQRSTKFETIRFGSPFNFTGTTYVLNRNGREFKLEKASTPLPVAPLPPNLAVGQKAIPFQMVALDGTKIDFPKPYAGKIVLLDFWATWCGPCIAELPNVKKAYADWHDKGFEILGISFDNVNMEEKVKAFLQEHDLPWPQIYEGKGWTTTLGEQYDVHAIPFVLLVDGDSGEILATVRDLRGPGLSEFVGKQLAKKNG